MFTKDMLQQLEQAAVRAAETQISQDGNIAGLWQQLGSLADQPDLPDLLEQARSAHWSGAVPMPHENPMDTFDLAENAAVAITGIDGSQVYPDPDDAVLWGYANAHAVRMGGKGLEFQEERFLEEADLLNRDGYLLPHVVDAVRTAMEMQAAARAVQEWPDDLALMDGSLLPFTGVARQQNEVAAAALINYINSLAACRNRLIASVISSPRSRLLINLIRLADGTVQINNKKRGARDIDLMRHGLPIGARSAVFLHGSPRNDAFHAQDAAICFFFVRISSHEVVRIEVPVWVAMDPERLGVIHTSVLEDAKALNYPYLLARAHNSAVIREDVAQALKQRALRTFLEKGGIPPFSSAKHSFKQA